MMAEEKPKAATQTQVPSNAAEPAWVESAIQNRGIRVAAAPPRIKAPSKAPQLAAGTVTQAVRPRRRAPARRQGMSIMYQMLFAVILLGLFALSLPTALLLTFALLPALCACLVGPRQGYYSAISIGVLSFAGAWSFLLKLWLSGHTVANAMQIIINPKTWLIIYGAAAFGWAMCQWFPICVSSFMSVFSAHRLKDLEQKQKKLIEEWGEEVANPQAGG